MQINLPSSHIYGIDGLIPSGQCPSDRIIYTQEGFCRGAENETIFIRMSLRAGISGCRHMFFCSHNPVSLFDNDKLSVGSDYTVRGYPDGSLYGNNAWYVKSDLTKSWAVNLNTAALQSLSLFAGFDYGHVRCETDNPLSCGNIYGVVAGMGLRGRYLTSSLTVGWPLKKVSVAFRRRPTLRMDMTWGF